MQSDKKNLCFVCASLRGGGSERVIATLANELLPTCNVTIILLSKRPIFYELDQRVTVSEFDDECFTKRRITQLYLMAKFIRREVISRKIDVVYSFGESINAFVLFSLIFVNTRKYVCNRASPHASQSGMRAILNPMLYPLANGIVVQTQMAVHMLRRSFPLSKFYVIPNPIEVPVSIKPIAERSSVVMSVGYLGGKKNQAALIRSFLALENCDEWKLILVGDGPNRERLSRLSQELGGQERVIFLGERKDARVLLQDAQVFAFTSLSEGFPNALAEAQAAGCACISFDCSTGPGEIIEHQQTGILVPSGDIEKFGFELEKLLRSPRLRRQLSAAGVKSAQKFDSARIAECYTDLLDGTLGGLAKA